MGASSSGCITTTPEGSKIARDPGLRPDRRLIFTNKLLGKWTLQGTYVQRGNAYDRNSDVEHPKEVNILLILI